MNNWYKLLIIVMILLTSLLYAGPYDNEEQTNYMRTELVLVHWKTEWVNANIDDTIIGYGLINTFGDEYAFAGTKLVLLQLTKDSVGLDPCGIDLGFEAGGIFPISKKSRVLVAAGYSYVLLVGVDGGGYAPSIRLGFVRDRFQCSLGYNSTYGMFSTIGLNQIF